MDYELPIFKLNEMPALSDWKCEICGPMGLVFRPAKGAEPNAFNRLMQRIFFGFRWMRA